MKQPHNKPALLIWVYTSDPRQQFKFSEKQMPLSEQTGKGFVWENCCEGKWGGVLLVHAKGDRR